MATAMEESNDHSSQLFQALSRRRFDDLLSLESKSSLLCVLPCLCRMTLYPSGLDDILLDDDRNKLRALLLEFSRTNTLVTFMGVDFSVLESDLRKELALRKKTLNTSSSNGNVETLFGLFSVAAIGHRFEMGDPAEKFRLLMSEILTMRLLVKEIKGKQQITTTTGKGRNAGSHVIVKQLRKFEPLDNEAYFDDCCDLLSIFLAERPDVVSIEELCDILVYYRNGPTVIRSMVMNFPDAWLRVGNSLIEGYDNASVSSERSLVVMKRKEVLNMLCSLNKLGSVEIINQCVEKRKLRLAISLGLQYLPDEFIKPLILSCLSTVDDHQRSSLLNFIQNAQKEWPILHDLNLPKSSKRSAAPTRVEDTRKSANIQQRVQYTEADETILDIIGQDSEVIVDLKRIRDLWEKADDENDLIEPTSPSKTISGLTADGLVKALQESSKNPSAAILALRRILRADRVIQSEYVAALTESMPALLDQSVPLHVIQLAAKLWSKMEPVSPRRLYVLTVAALLPAPSSRLSRTSWHRRTTHLDMCRDPLTILRCDERVFRCAPILSLLLRILRCYLAASRVHLQRELTMVPAVAAAEKEELMRSLIGAQESAAVQILLEACLPMTSETTDPSHLTSLREIRCIICSFVHQMFISDPILSKLVHFQTYPSELLRVTVPGIPSMHICLDFIPELLSQPINSKRVFAINLLSFLCEHYAIPKAFSLARLAVNVLFTLVGAVACETVVSIFSGLLPALSRIRCVFPPLSSDIRTLLLQVSRISQSRLATNDNTAWMGTNAWPWPNLRPIRSENNPESSLVFDIQQMLRNELSE